MYEIRDRRGGGDETGPKQHIWAISEFFFLFFIFFLKPTNVYSVYIIVVYEIHDGRGGDDENGTKQHWMHCLGHK